MVMLLFTVSTFLGRKVALLEDMVVDPSCRDQGIGSRLLKHAVSFARNEGFGRITLLTDCDNAGAQQFYERSGFLRSSMLVMRKPLENGDTA
jgi:ribosomal protein S18 acetylase RimI-like enzyme